MKPRSASAVPQGDVGDSVDVLRKKYDDYCSAQIADVLLRLTPDEIFEIAQKATAEAGTTVALPWTETVGIATHWLSQRVPLPPFDVWVEDYRAHPDRYEDLLIGFWDERGSNTPR